MLKYNIYIVGFMKKHIEHIVVSLFSCSVNQQP